MPNQFINQTKLFCRHCGTLIWSERSGQFKQCSCGEHAIDETEHYTRIIGDMDTCYKLILNNDLKSPGGESLYTLSTKESCDVLEYNIKKLRGYFSSKQLLSYFKKQTTLLITKLIDKLNSIQTKLT